MRYIWKIFFSLIFHCQLSTVAVVFQPLRRHKRRQAKMKGMQVGGDDLGALVGVARAAVYAGVVNGFIKIVKGI